LLGDRDLVQAVLQDFRTAAISDKDRALFTLLEKVNRARYETTHADLDACRAVGWSDEALYDALTVCALFQFYTTWIESTGVQDMPAMAYEMSGQRLATQGYGPDEP
jgi:hypothetical protein